jgi:hypothetical protein
MGGLVADQPSCDGWSGWQVHSNASFEGMVLMLISRCCMVWLKAIGQSLQDAESVMAVHHMGGKPDDGLW